MGEGRDSREFRRFDIWIWEHSVQISGICLGKIMRARDLYWWLDEVIILGLRCTSSVCPDKEH